MSYAARATFDLIDSLKDARQSSVCFSFLASSLDKPTKYAPKIISTNIVDMMDCSSGIFEVLDKSAYIGTS